MRPHGWAAHGGGGGAGAARQGHQPAHRHVLPQALQAAAQAVRWEVQKPGVHRACQGATIASKTLFRCLVPPPSPAQPQQHTPRTCRGVACSSAQCPACIPAWLVRVSAVWASTTQFTSRNHTTASHCGWVPWLSPCLCPVAQVCNACATPPAAPTPLTAPSMGCGTGSPSGRVLRWRCRSRPRAARVHSRCNWSASRTARVGGGVWINLRTPRQYCVGFVQRPGPWC